MSDTAIFMYRLEGNCVSKGLMHRIPASTMKMFLLTIIILKRLVEADGIHIIVNFFHFSRTMILFGVKEGIPLVIFWRLLPHIITSLLVVLRG